MSFRIFCEASLEVEIINESKRRRMTENTEVLGMRVLQF